MTEAMDGVSNFRELGGLTAAGGSVRRGVLFRSGHLAGASDEDRQRIADLGIRTVVDLRTDHDIAEEGEDRLPDGIDHQHVPIRDDAGRGPEIRALVMRGDVEQIRSVMGDGRGHSMATEGAADFVRRESPMASFARAMAIVADPDRWPVLWHCSAGKDRAGWVATAALLATGTERDVIVDHYLESNAAADPILSIFPDGEVKELLRPFLVVHEDFVRAQLAAVDERFGGTAALYRDGFGLADESMTRFARAAVS